jgi:hypothetical protein
MDVEIFLNDLKVIKSVLGRDGGIKLNANVLSEMNEHEFYESSSKDVENDYLIIGKPGKKITLDDIIISLEKYTKNNSYQNALGCSDCALHYRGLTFDDEKELDMNWD